MAPDRRSNHTLPDPVQDAYERRLRALTALLDAELSERWSAGQLLRLVDALAVAAWVAALAEAERDHDEIRATVLTLELADRARSRAR